MATISIFELFTIGIGPSSSHTVGPMKAAALFASHLEQQQLIPQISSLQCELYGSLGATGKGHGTDKAILLGLEGEAPDEVDVQTISESIERITSTQQLQLLGKYPLAFRLKSDLSYLRKSLPLHPNGMIFRALDASGEELFSKTYYSLGGGFVLDESEEGSQSIKEARVELPYRFHTAKELLELCTQHNKSISDLMLENEQCWRSKKEVKQGILKLWDVMKSSVQRGLQEEGTLPGGMKVKRRAAILHQRLQRRAEASLKDPLSVMDWVNLYALAVSEENAAGGRVVTAPTNGAAGIIPATALYCERFCDTYSEERITRFFLAAAAIGILYKENASISGADVGCQGEVGVACSMAAAGLAEFLGGTPEQVENAAEIAMEHNLGLTCDPVGGLVQVPCIERNAMGAIKALTAARMAIHGDGEHFVSLDKVIKTMRDTGADMKTKYKETSRGGLAVNVIEC